jgi:hypothetical protein
MKMPTPVDQLPSFNLSGNPAAQPGGNKWVPYIIVGGILLVAIGVSFSINREIQRKRINLKTREDERTSG